MSMHTQPSKILKLKTFSLQKGKHVDFCSTKYFFSHIKSSFEAKNFQKIYTNCHFSSKSRKGYSFNAAADAAFPLRGGADLTITLPSFLKHSVKSRKRQMVKTASGSPPPPPDKHIGCRERLLLLLAPVTRIGDFCFRILTNAFHLLSGHKKASLKKKIFHE